MINRFFLRHSFKIILVVIFLLPVLSRGARKALLSNDNNVHDWLPDDYPETAEFSRFQQYFENETFVLISWDGCTLDDPRLELFARKVIPPKDETQTEEEQRATLAERMPQKPAGGDFIWSGWFDREKTKDNHAWRGPLFKQVQTGTRLMDKLTSPPLSLKKEQALARLNKLFVGPDKHQSCAVVTLTEAGKFDLRYTLDKLYSIATDELGLPRDRVRLGGPPVDNVAIGVEGEKTLIRLFIPAGIVGLSLAFWCLRSVRLTMMVFSAALYAGAISLALVYYSGGSMNAILLTMPAVVYVAGISGAIHFANYYRDSVAESGVEGAPARALQHSWLPCLLAAGTTAAGLASLYTSELLPIKMFGVYSAAGVIATLGLLFLFLPSWMQLWPMRPHSFLDGAQPKAEDIDLPKRWRNLLEGVISNYKVVLACLLCLMVFCGIGLTKINTSIKLTKLFSSDAPIIHDYTWLESKLGPLVPMEVVIRIDNKTCPMDIYDRMVLVRKIQDAMQDIPDIGNTMSATTFAPSLELKRVGLLGKNVMRGTLKRKLEDHRQEYVDGDFLDMAGDTELWRISARVGALNDVDYGVFKDDIRARVEPVLRAERKRLAQVAAQVAVKEAEEARLTAAGAEPDENSRQKLKAATTAAALAAVPTGNMGVEAVYTGLVPVVYKAQREMLKGLAWNFVTDVLTIATVLSLVFWDISAGFLLLVPSVFPMVIVFGIMGWLGVVIDVGTIMTPTVALGVSVDDVVHFLIWYRRGLAEGKTRHQAIMQAYEGCARAMYQSWAVLGLGLAVFAWSSFVPTQRFGAMMFTLLTAALIGNLIMLPCFLASPGAKYFGRRLSRRAAAGKVHHAEHAPAKAAAMAEVASQPSQPVRRDKPHRSATGVSRLFVWISAGIGLWR